MNCRTAAGSATGTRSSYTSKYPVSASGKAAGTADDPLPARIRRRPCAGRVPAGRSLSCPRSERRRNIPPAPVPLPALPNRPVSSDSRRPAPRSAGRRRVRDWPSRPGAAKIEMAFPSFPYCMRWPGAPPGGEQRPIGHAPRPADRPCLNKRFPCAGCANIRCAKPLCKRPNHCR